MTSITHKRVEYTELFYDLVFVYAISKTTALIHHLDNGMVTFESMLTFLLTLIILLNNWLIQTGFTNRHGKNSLLNMFVSYLNMVYEKKHFMRIIKNNTRIIVVNRF